MMSLARRWLMEVGEPPKGEELTVTRDVRRLRDEVSIGSGLVGWVDTAQLLTWDSRTGPLVVIDWDEWRSRKLKGDG